MTELATLVPLVALCIWIGVYPKPFLAFLHKPAEKVAALVQPAKFGAQTVHAATAAPAGEPGAATPAPEPH